MTYCEKNNIKLLLQNTFGDYNNVTILLLTENRLARALYGETEKR